MEMSQVRSQQFEFSTDSTSERGIVADSSSERRRITHDNTEFPKRIQQQPSDRSGIVEKKSEKMWPTPNASEARQG
jgi:hypothetical protein